MGQPRLSYIALTGGVGEWLDLSNKDDSIDLQQVYQRVATAIKHGSVVIVSSSKVSAWDGSLVQRRAQYKRLTEVRCTVIYQ